MSSKYALIIGNTEYVDPGLAQLTAPGKDAEDFARILKDDDICAFDDVNILLNQPEYIVRGTIDEFFDQKKPDHLLVLYFSGHGVRDELGALYLAVKNTNRFRLRSTALKSDFIREAMDQSRSKRQVLILDCCNSGAFAQGTKAATGVSIGTAIAFEAGYGRVILTASDSTQFAWEGDKVIGNTDNSLFTHFLVQGLEGEADLDGDGHITVDELYDYAYEKVKLATPKQTPSKFSSKQQGEIVLRQSMRIEDIKPVTLPDELIEATEDARTFVREGAVQQLEKLLKGKNLGLARSAREALERMEREDDSRRVSQAATQVLEPIRQAEQRAEEEQRAREEAERLAILKADEERLAEEKAKTERLLAEQKAEEERKAKKEAKRLAVLKAKEERLAREKAEAKRLEEQKAEEERIAREKAEAEAKAKEEAQRLAAQKAEEQRLAREKAEKERKAKEEAERLATLKAKEEAESLARSKAKRESAEKAAHEKAKNEAKLKAALDEIDRQAAEKSAREKAERKAKEESERDAAQWAEELEERIERAKSEAERKTKEKSKGLDPETEEERLGRKKAKTQKEVAGTEVKPANSLGVPTGTIGIVVIALIALILCGFAALNNLPGIFGSPATEPPATEALATEAPATEPPATDAPTEAPTEPPATEAPATEAALSEFSDTFEDNSNGWEMRSGETEYAVDYTEISGGVFIWDVTEVKSTFIAYESTPVEYTDDYFVSVNARRIAGDPSSYCYAIAFRVTSVGKYLFEVCDSQTFGVHYNDGNRWQVLHDWTTTSAIITDDWNSLAVQASGNHFQFYINGENVAELDDARLESGGVLLAISVHDTMPGQIWFDDFFVGMQ